MHEQEPLILEPLRRLVVTGLRRVFTIDGGQSVHRTDYQGVNRIKINDAQFGFGAPDAYKVAIEYKTKTHGRVYRSTLGPAVLVFSMAIRLVRFPLPGTFPTFTTSSTTILSLRGWLTSTASVTTHAFSNSHVQTKTHISTAASSRAKKRFYNSPQVDRSLLLNDATTKRKGTTSTPGIQKARLDQCGGAGWDVINSSLQNKS